MKSFIELVEQRKSTRLYKDKDVSREDILSCIEAARLAPSGENVQPWRFMVINEPELRNKLTNEACKGIYRPTSFIKKAPVIIAVLAETSFIVHKIGAFLQKVPFYLLDIGMACEHLVLRAEELGLGTCYIGWYHVNRTKKVLNLSKKEKLVCLISLGYPYGKNNQTRKRKKIEDIVSFNLE